MKKYKSFLKENITNATELASELQKEILSIFPHSTVHAEFTTRFYPSIMINFMLAKDRTECVNSIEQNDIAYQTLTIEGKGKAFDKDGTLPEVLTIENKCNSFPVKATEKYMDYGRITVPFRKTSGNPQKMIDYTRSYFLLFKKMLQEHREGIPEHALKLIGHKF